MDMRFIVKLACVCIALAAIEIALVYRNHVGWGVGLAAWTLAIWIAGFDEGRRTHHPRHSDHH